MEGTDTDHWGGARGEDAGQGAGAWLGYYSEHEMDDLRGIVARHFQVYDTKPAPEMAAFYVNLDLGNLESRFEELRLDLRERGYVPLLRERGGEHVIFVSRMPKRHHRGRTVNLAFLVATIASTTLAGALLWASYMDSDRLLTLANIGYGALFFSLPLMTILGVHEMGHYLMAKRHKVAASLPFFMPLPPPMFILGTMGAVISIREPIPSKKSLLDIGFAGPVSGFLVALPVALLGLYLTNLYGVEVPLNSGDLGSAVIINLPLIYLAMIQVFPLTEGVVMHPTAFAGWAGLFVTALNLLPVGQLDGGHVSKALLGERARLASYGTAITVAVIGVLLNAYVWLVLIVILLVLGMSHPPPLNDITPLDGRRKLVGLLAVGMLVLCFMPVPFSVQSPSHDFRFTDGSAWIRSVHLTANSSDEVSTTIWVENTGNTFDIIGLSLQWVENFPGEARIEGWETNDTLQLNESEAAELTLTITTPPDIAPGTYMLALTGNLQESTGVTELRGRERLLNIELVVL